MAADAQDLEPGASAAGSIAPYGGMAWSENRDSGANILFMVAVVCDLCGYTMLFNSEKLTGPQERTIQIEP